MNCKCKTENRMSVCLFVRLTDCLYDSYFAIVSASVFQVYPTLTVCWLWQQKLTTLGMPEVRRRQHQNDIYEPHVYNTMLQWAACFTALCRQQMLRFRYCESDIHTHTNKRHSFFISGRTFSLLCLWYCCSRRLRPTREIHLFSFFRASCSDARCCCNCNCISRMSLKRRRGGLEANIFIPNRLAKINITFFVGWF